MWHVRAGAARAESLALVEAQARQIELLTARVAESEH
jgi:hypothetical protein